MDFEWILFLIFIPTLIIIPVGYIIIALYERKWKKSSKMKVTNWGTEKRLKGKVDANGNVACSDCGKLCDPDQMSAFGYWSSSYHSYDRLGGGVLYGEVYGYEEIIPNKKTKHTYLFVKDFCSSCANRLRTEVKIQKQEHAIIPIVIFIFILVILLKALPKIWLYMKNLF
jgi:hypothetical protein